MKLACLIWAPSLAVSAAGEKGEGMSTPWAPSSKVLAAESPSHEAAPSAQPIRMHTKCPNTDFDVPSPILQVLPNPSEASSQVIPREALGLGSDDSKKSSQMFN